MHVRIKGKTEMLEFPTIPNQYELMTHAEYRKRLRYKHPKKKSPNETSAVENSDDGKNVSEHTL